MSKAQGKCPVCKSETMPAYRPFCSKRCADVDLGRWLTGAFAIPGGSADDDEDGLQPPMQETAETSGEA